MKIRFIAIGIILGSMISGLLGSYVFLYHISPELNNIITKTITQEVVKNGSRVTITELESEVTDLITEVGPSVVNIIIKKDIDMYRRDPWGFFQEKVGSVERQVGGGSGFFVAKDGTIMTNKHVVYDTSAKYTVITSDGAEYDAQVIALDQLTDLAIIKIENSGEEFPVVKMVEDEKYINIGQFAIAIGNALGEFQNSVSFGVISGKNRSIEASGGSMGSEKLSGLLQTDTAINPGNSGGPLLNLAGEVVGINTAISGNGQGLGFSIPLSKKRVDFILSSIEKYGKIKRPFLGIAYIPLNKSMALELGLGVEYGAYIPKESGSLVDGGSAKASGVETGDIILSIDGNKITLDNPIQSIIQNKIPGDIITLEVLKSNDEKKEISVELGEY